MSWLRRSLNRQAVMRVAAASIAFGWGCGDSTSPPAPVASASLSSTESLELVAGGAQMLTVTAKDAKGNVLVDRITTWTSSDPAVVTVVAGLVTGVALGSATITASVEGVAASVTANVRDGLLVTPGGSSFTSQDGVLSVVVPAGAVASPASLTIQGNANPPANPRLLPGTSFNLGSGATFAQPFTITIKYNPSAVASDSPESGLQLYELNGTSWRVVPGSTVNTGNKTVSGSVTHGGTFAVLMQPRVETVTIGGDVAPVPVVTTRQLTATLKDNEGTTLTRAVAWTSSDPAIASVSPTNGLVTAKIPGTVTITAQSEGKSATVSISVVPGPPSKLIALTGNNQSVPAGAAVTVLPSVKVTDAGDNPIANVPVTFAIGSGGGTVTGGTTTTNASGIATVGGWTLGTAAGPNSLIATSSAIAGASFTFNAAGGAGPAANIVAFAGNNQTGTAGGLIPSAPSVKVTDANGNFVSGFTVTFSPGSGSGIVSGGSAVSDPGGIAKPTSWRLGTTPGAQTLIATASGLAGSPITFNATAVAPVPSALAGFAGNNQTARPGSPVPTNPSWIVTDTAGVPVPGVTVTIQVTAGGGSVTAPTAVTNSSGIASVGWTLGTELGANSLTASIPGGIPAVTFNATVVQPPPTRIAVNAGDNQSAIAGQAVAVAPSVKITDSGGIGVPGVNVTFSIRTGSGSITGANAVTNAQGIATIGSWILGIGGNSLIASRPGLSGDPVVFVASGYADVQIVTFGDSNTDLGFSGTNPSPKAGSYVSSTNPAIKLGANAPNDATQLAGKIEARWRANRSSSIKAVNHAIAGTSTGTGRSILLAPNALEQVGGVSRFRGEMFGDAYPWNGGEPVNEFYPTGSIQRVQAFKPRKTADFGYISMGTNDIPEATSTTVIAANLEIMVDEWISRDLPPNRLMITTIPPRRASEGAGAKIADLNVKIRNLAQRKGIRLIDISSFVSNGDGVSWKSSSGDGSYPGPLHVDNDELHYSETVRNWIADQVVSIMINLTP